MECAACGHGNREGRQFCGGCGAPLAVVCPSCGRPDEDGERFCGHCGAELGGRAPVAPKEPPPPLERDPRAYTPKHLAERILQSKSALEGERKQVTVLFADVKGSMELAEQVDPEVWHGILDRFFQILADGVHRYEGTVNQYTGDGIMALFGAPIAHEDHAQRACYAALQLRDELANCAREVKREHGLGFSVRIGLNSGEVVVGKIGDDLRMDYTAQGHTVGLAARMQELASPDTTYLTGDVAGLVTGYFELDDLGAFQVKGVAERVPVFQLMGLGALRTRLDVSRARGLTRFVGRDDDLHTLESALERCFQGEGGVIGLVAQAGVGKSRLCFEFVERCRARGLRVLEGRAAAHGRNVPFLPILQVFRAYFGIDDHDDDRTAREKIAGRLLLLDEAFREALPVLFEFLGVPDPNEPAARGDADSRQRRLFQVLRRLVQSGRTEAPIVTLIEDLHWLDAGSESWVAEMVDATAEGPGLLLLNYRPEFHAEWMQKSYYRQLPLSPLGPDAIRELLSDLLGNDPSIAGLAEKIHERTAGNPFFAEEVVQSLIESGTLQGTRGSYRLVTPVPELSIPDSVLSILAARIDRLAEREKQLLHTAAVIGKEFPEPILEQVVGLPRAELTGALGALKAAEFIYEQSLYPVAEYAFKHPLTQEVALHSQLRERRGRIHAAVAGAIESTNPERLDENAALLAHHWEEAGEPIVAARWHRRAAERAGMTHADASVRHLRAVWELPRDEESAETIGLRVEAAGQILTMGLRSGMAAEELEPFVVEGKQLLERSEDPQARIHFLRGHGTFVTFKGDFLAGAELLVRARDLAQDIGAPELAIGPELVLAIGRLTTGPVDVALAGLEKALQQLDTCSKPPFHAMGYDSRAIATSLHGWFLAEAGELERASRQLDEALELGRRLDDRSAICLAHGVAAEIANQLGDVASALAHATRSVDVAQGLGTPTMLGIAYVELGLAHLLDESWESAIELLELGAETNRALAPQRAMESGSLGLALLAAGRPSEAVAAVAETLEVCRSTAGELRECPTQLALAQVLAETEGASARPRIEAAIERACELVERTGGRSRIPRVHLARAALARALGDDATREQELREAQRLYAQMGATGRAERVAREL